MEWTILVGVIGMEHPFGVPEPKNGNIGIAAHNFRAKDILLEDKGCADVLDQQIYRQTSKGTAISRRWHLRVFGSKLHRREPLADNVIRWRGRTRDAV